MTNTQITRINPAGMFDSSVVGFSQVVTAPAEGTAVFVSGQFSGDESGTVLGDDVPAQMRQCFRNLKLAIAAAGAKPEHVVKIVVLIVDHNERFLAPLDAEIKDLFGDALPASTLIPVPRLALDAMLFEIEATLFVPA